MKNLFRPFTWWRMRKHRKVRARKVQQFRDAGVKPITRDEWRKFTK